MSGGAIEEIGKICGSGKPYDDITQEVCTALRNSVAHYNWVGVYMVEDEKHLILKGWDGPAATEHVRIPVGKGVCGAAAQEGRTIIVDDVREDPRYLTCFLNTRAEIVVPIFVDGKVIGEIDIDSDVTSAFGETDQVMLEWVASKLGDAWQEKN